LDKGTHTSPRPAGVRPRNRGPSGGTVPISGDLAQGNWVDEFDNDPDYRGGALGDSPAKVWPPEG